jgi:V/A-type H+/Na+-transporting ATPase subunit E
MSSELIQLLEQEARVEKDKVLSEARARAEEILAAARREAEEIVASARQKSEAERAQSRTRAASAVSLRAAALLLEAKDHAIREVFERAESELARVSADPARRQAMLRNLLAEAMQGLETKGATVEVPVGDGPAARAACRDLGPTVEVRETSDVSGGVRVTTRDRRVAVENTIGSRLRRTRAALVSRVAEILWGG